MSSSWSPPTIPVRGLFAGCIADIRGRIFCNQYIFPVHTFRFLVVSVVKHYPVFSVGLDTAGVGIGVGLTANTVLLAEIVPKELRGLELLLLTGVGSCWCDLPAVVLVLFAHMVRRRVVEISVDGQK